MQRRWMTALLLFLGLTLCLLVTVGIGFLLEMAIALVAAPSGRARFHSDLEGWILAVLFVVLYIGWTWLVLRSKPRKQPRAFEVLPPKQ